jgi:hypothetical protein
MVDGLFLITTKDIDFLFYEGCAYGKQHCQNFPTNIVCKKVSILSELIHANLCGPMNVPSIGNSLYFVLFKDNCSGYRIIFCVRKSQAFEYLQCMLTQCNATLEIL